MPKRITKEYPDSANKTSIDPARVVQHGKYFLGTEQILKIQSST